MIPKPEDLSFTIPDFESDTETLLAIADRYFQPEYEHIQRQGGPRPNPEHKNCIIHLCDIPEDLIDLPIVQDCVDFFSGIESQQGTKRQLFERLFFFNIVGPLEDHIDSPDDYIDTGTRGLVDNGAGRGWAGPIGQNSRSIAFNIPLRGCTEVPTIWKYTWKGDVIHEHHYTGPALINTEYIHGVPDNQGQRLLFSLGGFYERLTDVRDQLISEGKATP